MGLYRKGRVKRDSYGKWELFPGWHLKIHSAVLFTEIDTGMENAQTHSCRKEANAESFASFAYLAGCALCEIPHVLMFTKQWGTQCPTRVHRVTSIAYAWIFQGICYKMYVNLYLI